MNILQNIEQESGLEFLERLQPRPRIVLKDLLPFFDLPIKDPNENSTRFQREIVEICGPSDSGKSLLMLQTICRIILPTAFGGNEVGTIFINLDQHIENVHFLKTIQQLLATKKFSDILAKNDVIAQSLSRLWVMNIFDCDSYQISLFKVVEILSSNRHISLLAVDNLSSFYHVCRQKAPSQSLYFDRFIQQEVKRLIFRQFDAHLLYCKEELFSGSRTSEGTSEETSSATCIIKMFKSSETGHLNLEAKKTNTKSNTSAVVSSVLEIDRPFSLRKIKD